MFEEQLQNIYIFFQTNPIIAASAGVLVIVLFYFKPKAMFKLVGFCLFIVVVFYCLTLLAGTVGSGTAKKDQMMHKTKEALGE